MTRRGITIKPTIGVGDGLQFTSLPENYFRATGERLIDVSKPWFFDHNPFVVRDETPDTVTELWNFGPRQWTWPRPQRERPAGVYTSNAEIWASLFGVPVRQNRPRLYRFEVVPFIERQKILVHCDGVSHGRMEDHVLQHVLTKYGPTGQIYFVGRDPPKIGLPTIETPTLWDLAAVVSTARIFIGMDSGPSWVAACYPDVITKKIRVKPEVGRLASWIPLEIANIHSHWDDRCHQIYNTTEEDVGFTSSYKKL